MAGMTDEERREFERLGRLAEEEEQAAAEERAWRAAIDSKRAMEEEERQRNEYLALPPLQRIEKWSETCGAWPLGMSLRTLGRALRDWAREQTHKH